MNPYTLLRLTLTSWFYAWALREICPLHPDVPEIVQRKNAVDQELRNRWK